MAPHHPPTEDFLFSLNQAMSQTATPTSIADHQSNSVHTGGNDANNHHSTSSILAGLNAFSSEDADSDSNAASTGWQDQLALWTNASFSFDGPTGHALLLDEDKDDGSGRAEGSSRPNGYHAPQPNGQSHNDDADRHLQGNGHAHGGGNGNNDYSNGAGAGPENTAASVHDAPEPTHRGHKLQADQLQQSQYFAPPTSNAGEGRRPGRNVSIRDDNRLRRHEASPEPSSADRNGHTQDISIGQNAFSAFSAGQEVDNHSTPRAGQQQQQQHATPFGFPAPFGQMSPEFLQALAFQQILSGGGASHEFPQGGQNPLALASLVSMGALNPAFGGGMQPQGTGYPSQFPQGPGMPLYPFHQSGHSTNASRAASTSSNDREDAKDGKSFSKKRRQSRHTTEEMSPDNALARADAEVGRAAREEIPPLQLIDTGNPEADAEANRLAIEEDKRRRNTAASARFRIKKKQREQALEQTTKELESRVRELEESNSTLERENGWLKSLIHVRHGHPLVFPHGIPLGASMPSPATQPPRDTGLQPRGVGTLNGSGHRHGEEFQLQRSQPSATAIGKRARED